ncbi:MAG: OsmC family protein [Anaerolineae bacterium]|nr:OsmC family protein [Anaerolineae bacterium]
MTPRLASAAVTTQLLGLRGRTIVNTKEHHLVVDSPLYLGGPNEEINPIDLLLSSLATHALFTIEKYAQQNRIPLDDLKISVSADYDPRGVLGEQVDSGLQALTVQMLVMGPSEAQLAELTDAFTRRCLIYVTLARAVKIDLDVSLAKTNGVFPAIAK